MSSKRQVAVVGCGPSGLVAAKELKEQGFEVILFERSAIGGVASSSYDFTFTTSTPFSMFSDYRIEELDKQPRFFSGRQYCEYLQGYAKHFGLTDRIVFEEVACVERLGRNVLKVTTTQSGRQFTVSHLVVASGANQEARRIPEALKGFSGHILHSHDYKTNAKPVDLSGKRVLVVGGGESASDLVRLIAPDADVCAMSTRSGTGFVVPRWNGEDPTDMETSRLYHMIPRALICWVMWIRGWKRRLFHGVFREYNVSRKCLDITVDNNFDLIEEGLDAWHTYGTKNEGFAEAMASHGAKKFGGIECAEGPTVSFTTGERQDFDVVVLCTGFQVSFPFLEKGFPAIARDASTDIRSLFKNILHPDANGEIFFCGFVRPNIGAVPVMSELQARWIALVCSEQVPLPNRAALVEAIQQDNQRFVVQFKRDVEKRALRDFLVYIDEMAVLIGCNVRLKELFLSEPRLWFRCLAGPLTACQFRLSGPGAKRAAARACILQPPLGAPFNLFSAAFVLAMSYCLTVFYSRSYTPIFVSADSKNIHGVFPHAASAPAPNSWFAMRRGKERRQELFVALAAILLSILAVFIFLHLMRIAF